jgi:DNA-binding MarR family transcriptional regulator
MDIDSLASSLRATVSALRKRLRKQAYSVDTYSMTEIATISLLYKEGLLFPSELAALTKVRPQSMSQILNKLEKQGIIKKIPSKEDRRKTYISLTASGREVVEHTRYERDEWLAKTIETTLTEKEKKTIEEAIVILNKLAEAE